MDQQILFNSKDQSMRTFENFYAAENSNIISALTTFISGKGEFGCFYIYGESGSGKTHLLKSAIAASTTTGAYMDINYQADQLREVSNISAIQILSVDNVEDLSDHEADMVLLFETLKQRQAKLILASKFAPRALPLSLRDLSSRFLSGQVFELKMLDDQQKAKALELRAGLRGFKLGDEVISYVINRYPRDLNTLFDMLDKFDNASLVRQRKITVPFIKELENPE